ncbi:hypothetical protein BDV96DRAFT_590148 [Lophiotrema nucula]|uniref:trans-L-3-hydroxyproline dehydratase n=1 Tax=Lophiotrema nucula TaxID=690887 RepID=A0A6A5YIH2_9PLEO|nr:hypothetical protein BDV96DRAFT_590148 [Lophiotrema nucula]
MLEPVGNADMYGAILCPKTELTETGEAHIGVLFCHNEGYSTMCGHATIALGRFLVDTHDLSVFSQRDKIETDKEMRTAKVKLHAPCGVIEIAVPVTEDGARSDPSMPVSFVSVPSFATGKDVKIEIPSEKRWPQLKDRESVAVSFCYGGAFTCLVSAQELGLAEGLKQPVDVDEFDKATRILKDTINGDTRYSKYLKHPEYDELSSLYTTMVVDKELGEVLLDSRGGRDWAVFLRRSTNRSFAHWKCCCC